MDSSKPQTYIVTPMQKKKHPTSPVDILQAMRASNAFGEYFGVSQETIDKVWADLTAEKGNSVVYISMEIGADVDVYNPVKEKLAAYGISESPDEGLNEFINRFLHGPTKIPNYSGGLGILAGDTLKSMADCRIPAVAISLLYSKGYFS